MEVGTDSAVIRRGNGKGKVRLLTRQALDGRTRARKQFDAIASGIAKDLGGEAQLSTIQKRLLEAFAGIAVQVHDLNARLLLGEKVDISQQCQAVTTLVRIAARLPIAWVPRDVTPPSIDQYLNRARQPRNNGEATKHQSRPAASEAAS
jgi:hypothetical protein